MKLKNLRGIELAMSTIVVIIVVLIILITVTVYFFGGMGTAGGSLAGIGTEAEKSAGQSDISGGVENIKTVYGCWYCTDSAGKRYKTSSGKTFRGYADSKTCETNNGELYPKGDKELKECSKLGGSYSCRCI